MDVVIKYVRDVVISEQLITIHIRHERTDMKMIK